LKPGQGLYFELSQVGKGFVNPKSIFGAISHWKAMDSRHKAKVNQWFRGQRASGKAQDVYELSLEDPIARTLLREWLLQRGFNEIRADQDLFDAIFFEVVRLSSSSDLREMAVQLFERGDHQAAKDLTWIADHKERGDLPELLGSEFREYQGFA
jgi:hypothetical protein